MVIVYLSKNKLFNQNCITQLPPGGRERGVRKKRYFLPHPQTKNNCFLQYKTLSGVHGKIRQLTFYTVFPKGIFFSFVSNSIQFFIKETVSPSCAFLTSFFFYNHWSLNNLGLDPENPYAYLLKGFSKHEYLHKQGKLIANRMRKCR